MSETPTIPDGPPATQRSFGERLIGSLMLDASVYEEVEHDATAMGQAAGVVALSAVAAGIGTGSLSGLIGGVLAGLLGWVIGAAVVWLVGVQLMGHSSDMPELLRALGFASAPGVIAVLGIIPVVGWLGVIAAMVLSLIAWVLAVRQALDVDTGRAVVVCILVVLASIAIRFVLAALGLGMLTAATA